MSRQSTKVAMVWVQNICKPYQCIVKLRTSYFLLTPYQDVKKTTSVIKNDEWIKCEIWLLNYRCMDCLWNGLKCVKYHFSVCVCQTNGFKSRSIFPHLSFKFWLLRRCFYKNFGENSSEDKYLNFLLFKNIQITFLWYHNYQIVKHVTWSLFCL